MARSHMPHLPLKPSCGTCDRKTCHCVGLQLCDRKTSLGWQGSPKVIAWACSCGAAGGAPASPPDDVNSRLLLTAQNQHKLAEASLLRSRLEQLHEELRVAKSGAKAEASSAPSSPSRGEDSEPRAGGERPKVQAGAMLLVFPTGLGDLRPCSSHLLTAPHCSSLD